MKFIKSTTSCDSGLKSRHSGGVSRASCVAILGIAYAISTAPIHAQEGPSSPPFAPLAFFENGDVVSVSHGDSERASPNLTSSKLARLSLQERSLSESLGAGLMYQLEHNHSVPGTAFQTATGGIFGLSQYREHRTRLILWEAPAPPTPKDGEVLKPSKASHFQVWGVTVLPPADTISNTSIEVGHLDDARLECIDTNRVLVGSVMGTSAFRPGTDYTPYVWLSAPLASLSQEAKPGQVIPTEQVLGNLIAPGIDPRLIQTADGVVLSCRDQGDPRDATSLHFYFSRDMKDWVELKHLSKLIRVESSYAIAGRGEDILVVDRTTVSNGRFDERPSTDHESPSGTVFSGDVHFSWLGIHAERTSYQVTTLPDSGNLRSHSPIIPARGPSHRFNTPSSCFSGRLLLLESELLYGVNKEDVYSMSVPTRADAVQDSVNPQSRSRLLSR